MNRIFGQVAGIWERLSPGELSRNSVFALAQALLNLACIFAAYRILIAYAGIERLGLWSLLMAGSSLVQLGNISGGGALARFVAKEYSRGDIARAVRYVHTVILATLVLYGIAATLLYVFSDRLIVIFIDPIFQDEANRLAPYAIANVCLSSVALALFSAVDGTQRADLRAMVGMISVLFFLFMTWILVPRFAAEGFGIALIAQQLVMIGLAWLALRKQLAELGWFPNRLDKDIFLETTAFGLKIQAAAMVSMLFEPLAKLLLSQAGGLALLGVYELASRLVVQARALIIAAAQPLIAAFAGMLDNEKRERLPGLLVRATRIVIWTSAAMTLATVIASPIASWIMLGKLDTQFLLITFALAVGWNVNTFSSPIYYAAIASGIMKWNLLSHVAIAVSMIIGTYLLTPLIGTKGIIGTIVLSLLIATMITMIGNIKALALTNIWREINRSFAIGTAIIVAISIVGSGITIYWQD